MGATTMDVNRRHIHPHKFNMYLVLIGIVMFFAGFTSAYLVMHGRDSWIPFKMPDIFWASTVVILVSSATMHLALKNFRDHKMSVYRMWITLTVVLGVVFMAFQLIGFNHMYKEGLTLSWNLSAALLYIIFGGHVLHVFGGVIALIVIFFRAYRRKVRTYDPVPVEVVAIFWHFVDILWIYLYVFFLIVR